MDNGNVPTTDQRSHLVLVDDRYAEILARLPKGLQPNFAAVFALVDEAMFEKARLEGMRSIEPNGRGDLRILKGTYTQVSPEGHVVTTAVYTVMPKVQLEHYIAKVTNEIGELERWAYRMYRLLTADVGKSREEMVTALQAAQGRLLSPETGKTPIMFGIMPGPPVAQNNPKKSLFPGLGKR